MYDRVGPTAICMYFLTQRCLCSSSLPPTGRYYNAAITTCSPRAATMLVCEVWTHRLVTGLETNDCRVCRSRSLQCHKSDAAPLKVFVAVCNTEEEQSCDSDGSVTALSRTLNADTEPSS